jgi:hypothetical protein
VFQNSYNFSLFFFFFFLLNQIEWRSGLGILAFWALASGHTGSEHMVLRQSECSSLLQFFPDAFTSSWKKI